MDKSTTSLKTVERTPVDYTDRLYWSGIIKMSRQKNGPIVGVHGIGKRIGEQIGEAQLIVNWEAYPEDVAQFVHAHPTQNEALGEAAMALFGHPLHS